MRPRTRDLLPLKNELNCSCDGRSGSNNCMAFACTAPFVLGVHASTSHTRGSFTGEMRCADSRSLAQPGCLKSHGSRWAFSSPHAVICFTAHSAAALWLGEPVKRGP